jgi:hypothetical protein
MDKQKEGWEQFLEGWQGLSPNHAGMPETTGDFHPRNHTDIAAMGIGKYFMVLEKMWFCRTKGSQALA